jgi:hypothetical protein
LCFNKLVFFTALPELAPASGGNSVNLNYRPIRFIDHVYPKTCKSSKSALMLIEEIMAIPNSKRASVDVRDVSFAKSQCKRQEKCQQSDATFLIRLNRCNGDNEKMRCHDVPQNKKRPTKNPNNAITPTPPEYCTPGAAELESPKGLPTFDVVTGDDDDAATVLAAANFSSPAVTVTGR